MTRTDAEEARIARNVIRMLAEREGLEEQPTRVEIDAWTDAALGYCFGYIGEEGFDDSEVMCAAIDRLEADSVSIEFWREHGA